MGLFGVPAELSLPLSLGVFGLQTALALPGGLILLVRTAQGTGREKLNTATASADASDDGLVTAERPEQWTSAAA
jgi:hypothetical protein